MLMASICSGFRRIPAKTTRRNNHFFWFDGKSSKIFKARKADSLNYLQIQVEVYTCKSKKPDPRRSQTHLASNFHEEGLLSKSLSHCPDEAISAHPQDLFSSPPNNVGIERLRDTVSLLLYIVDWEWLNDSNDPTHVFGSWTIENLWSQSQRPACLTASHSLLEF